MTFHITASPPVARSSATVGADKEKFAQVMGEASPKKIAPGPKPATRTKAGPKSFGNPRPARPGVQAALRRKAVPKTTNAGKVLDTVNRAQARLDHLLRVAQTGKSFTPAELLGLQAQVSQVSQQLDLAGKVVEKATSGVKQVLQTQV